MTKDYYHKEWYLWRDEVLRQVRFTPDHTAIAKELYAHYEDHVRDLERFGYDEELARSRALAAMGDAEEVGRGLDAAHKPWLGWLLKATEWTAAAIALMLVITLVTGERVSGLIERINGQCAWEDPPAYADSVETEFGTLYMAAGETAQDENGLYCADLIFWMDYNTPMTDGPWTNRWMMEFTTDRGAVVPRQRDGEGNFPEDMYFQLVGSEEVFISDSFTRYRWPVRLSMKEKPTWVEVRLPYDDWTLEAEWR